MEAARDTGHAFAKHLPLVLCGGASLYVTNAYFKFGSFALELVGFAALWAALFGLTRLFVRTR
jgi:hypothetical protein